MSLSQILFEISVVDWKIARLFSIPRQNWWKKYKQKFHPPAIHPLPHTLPDALLNALPGCPSLLPDLITIIGTYLCRCPSCSSFTCMKQECLCGRMKVSCLHELCDRCLKCTMCDVPNNKAYHCIDPITRVCSSCSHGVYIQYRCGIPLPAGYHCSAFVCDMYDRCNGCR